VNLHRCRRKSLDPQPTELPFARKLARQLRRRQQLPCNQQDISSRWSHIKSICLCGVADDCSSLSLRSELFAWSVLDCPRTFAENGSRGASLSNSSTNALSALRGEQASLRDLYHGLPAARCCAAAPDNPTERPGNPAASKPTRWISTSEETG